MNKESDIRAILRFPEIVIKHFAFLVEWGFECIHVESTIVRYATKQININIFIGRHSFEIDVEFQKHDDRLLFCFYEMLLLLSCPEANTYKCYAATTAESVAYGVEILADLFKKRLTADVFDDNALFTRLEKQRNENARVWHRNMEVKHLRLQLDEAWKKRDFCAIIECAAFFNVGELTKSEIAKINHAHKRLSEHPRNPNQF